MSKHFFNKTFLLLLLSLLVLSGCTFGVGSGQKPSAAQSFRGGMFRSADGGASWEQIVSIYNINGQPLNFNGANITALALDPTDKAAIYIGTELSGIFYSYNYGQAWYNVVPGPGVVNDIAVDPKDRCTIFAAIHNSIFKSTDCSRSWKQVYFDNLPQTFITRLAINASNTNIVYAGSSGGTLIKSQDHGFSWDAIYRFNDVIVDIIAQNQLDSRIIYVATQSTGIFRNANGGDTPETWVDLMLEKVDQAEVDETEFIQLRHTAGAYNFIALAQDRSVPDGLLYANTTGLYRLNFGEMWKQIKMIPPQARERVYAVAVNPQNTNELFYSTNGAFYHSIDNGMNWNITKSPSSGWAKFLEFSLDNKYLYYGSYFIQ